VVLLPVILEKSARVDRRFRADLSDSGYLADVSAGNLSQKDDVTVAEL